MSDHPGAVKTRFSAIKLQQIMMAARHLFFGQGFSATSMEAVAREAGVGKATLYEHFPNKIELLRAVITSELEMRSDALVLKPAENGQLRAALVAFAQSLVDLLLAPSTVALYRIISAEVPRHPELGAIFYDNGPAQIIGRLADYFAVLMEQGRLLSADPRLAATQFIGVVRGDLQTRSLFGIDEAALQRERPGVVANGVDVFLRAYTR